MGVYFIPQRKATAHHRMDEIIFADRDEFWTYVQNSILPPEHPSAEETANTLFVRFLKTVADHVDIYINTDQDIYQCALYLLNSELYETHRAFCVAKILSLLTVSVLELNVKLFASYILLLDCKNDQSLLQLVLDYNGFEVLYGALHHCFKDLALLDKDKLEIGTLKTMKKACTIQLDILFQLCKYLSIPTDQLSHIDTFFINYIFESLVVAYDEEDVFNSAKFKFVLAVNEQFMIASRDQQIPNKVFETLSLHKSSSNFNECLLVYFNREEDRCLQIMMSKILYLILNDPRTADMFYHNDLNVLVDVLIRELSDLSEEEESVRHTFLRVLYLLLMNKQFESTRYKRNDLKTLLDFLSGASRCTFWNQTETTKRLASRCLSIDWIKKDDDELKQEELPDLELTQSNVSTASINSMSKKTPPHVPPPPPHPRKQLVNNRAHLYYNAASQNLR